MAFKDNMVGLIIFGHGAGSKLIQSQLDGSKELLSIPAYPLKYYYSHWNEWQRKYKKLNSKKILSLITRHHASILDTRLIPGFNGLTNLGLKRNKFIKIPKKIFEKNFITYLKKKEINSRNVLVGIHYAYFKARKKNLNKMKKILYHIHEPFYFNKNLIEDFKDSQLLVAVRNPINHFWQRVRADQGLEKDRFNYTDRIFLQNYEYLNRLLIIFIGFNSVKENFFSKYHFIKFEDLKTKNFITLKKIGKYLKIKISKSFTSPTFENLEWWSDKVYGKKHTKTFDGVAYEYKSDLKKFFSHEIFIIEFILKDYYKKFGYKFHILNKRNNFFNLLYFLISVFLPTKFGLKLFFSNFNLKKIKSYFIESFKECFFRNSLKNYYFNAMYKFKPQYKARYFLRFNFLRKIIFFNEKKIPSLILFVPRVLLFLTKIFTYLLFPFLQIYFYFYKIYYYLKQFLILKSILIK